MYLGIVSLPLIGFFIVGLGGRYYGRLASAFIATILIFFSFLISLFIWYEVSLSCAPVVLHLYTWLDFNNVAIKIGFLFDFITCSMLVVITSISFCVHLYSIGYLANDPHLTRFMAYLSLFTFWMLILVSADNFIQMFIGWEGVGLCSYLLINFWFTRIQANKAALKAIIVNRVADVFFILGIIMLFVIFKTTDYLVIFHLTIYMGYLDSILVFFGARGLEVITLLLLIGGVAKSAQIGLHVWLPDAMEGPTPVSALLHAATMVTAGVFLIIRCAPLFECTPRILVIIVLIGGFTTFIMSFIAVCQYDIKKVIAYSTCSQLGYMFFVCGYSQYHVALFHLYNHAFFKALLFLGAGLVIHACSDEQDMRYYGGFLNFLPFSYICLFIGSCAIIGFPFLTGFYSKELILELGSCRYLIDAAFIYFLAVLGAVNTTIYSWRILIFVFFGSTNANNFSLTEDNKLMFIPLFFLAVCSIFIGYIFSDIMIGSGTFIVNYSFFVWPWNYCWFDPEFVNPVYKNLPLIGSFLGFFLMQMGYFIIKKGKNKNLMFIFFHYGLNKIFCIGFYGFFFNIIYNRIFLTMYKLSYFLITKSLDKGALEFFGPYGLYRFFLYLGYKWRFFTSSDIILNIGYLCVSLSLIFWYFLFWNLITSLSIILALIFFLELIKNYE